MVPHHAVASLVTVTVATNSSTNPIILGRQLFTSPQHQVMLRSYTNWLRSRVVTLRLKTRMEGEMLIVISLRVFYIIYHHEIVNVLKVILLSGIHLERGFASMPRRSVKRHIIFCHACPCPAFFSTVCASDIKIDIKLRKPRTGRHVRPPYSSVHLLRNSTLKEPLISSDVFSIA